MKLQDFGLPSRYILQSQISLSAKNRFEIKEMTVVHARPEAPENTAKIVLQFAKGESMVRPKLETEERSQA